MANWLIWRIFRATHVEQLREWLRTRTAALAVVYTWSTERLSGLLGEQAADLSLLPLPHHLRARFGR